MTSLTDTANWLQLFGEQNRVRLLALLEGSELTVAELTAITELGQSRVSTHLGKLREAGVLRDRKVGVSTYYALNDAAMPEAARKLWAVVRGELADDIVHSDGQRKARVLGARSGQSWPDSIAGEMERHYSPGRTWEAYARGLVGLLRLGRVLDVGSGDGAIAELLLPVAKSVTCFDQSEKLLDAARARLLGRGVVELVQGDMHEMPFRAAHFDEVLLFNVLTQTEAPDRVLRECARVLVPHGRLALVTLAAHNHQDLTATYRHVQPGFAPDALRRLLAQAGFSVTTCDVAFRERREPHFSVLVALAERKGLP